VGFTKIVYTVHMKHFCATNARYNFFKIIDTAASGEPVIIERNGISLELRKLSPRKKASKKISYKGLIKGGLDNADCWSWKFDKSGNLKFRNTR